MNTDKYAVFGNPIAHSKSPLIHQAFATQTGHVIHYDRQCVPVDKFKQHVDAFFASEGKGLNITVPFKLEAYRYADQLTHRAQQAGAVNTLIANSDGSVTGDNTDGWGLVNDMINLQQWSLTKQRILVLGAGGAVRGVLGPLSEQQPSQIVIANRTVAKAQALAELFGSLCSSSSYVELAGQKFDIVINGTSASLADDLPPLPTALLNDGACCYDMMYANNATVFMQWATKEGAAAVSDGLGMLVSQGAESFRLWRNTLPDIAPVIAQLR